MKKAKNMLLGRMLEVDHVSNGENFLLDMWSLFDSMIHTVMSGYSWN